MSFAPRRVMSERTLGAQLNLLHLFHAALLYVHVLSLTNKLTISTSSIQQRR